MLHKLDAETIERVVDRIAAGGVVLLPTDTVYGLAASPNSEAAVDRVFALKGRPRNVNLPIMVSSQAQLEGLGLDVNEAAARLLRSPLVPGSLTLAMGFRDGPRPRWLEGRVEAAVRIPDDEWLLSTLGRTGPLLVTSANVHGVETPENLADVLAQLHGAPELAVDGGPLRTVPSTLVNCRLDPPVVERVGAIPEAEVLEYLR